MKRFLILLLMITPTVMAQSPPEHLIVAPETPLQQAIDQQLQVYADGGRPEVLRTSNALIYPHGVYQPVLTCTVLRICIIELEPGEAVYSMGAGDHVRWNIDHGSTGPGGNTTYITIVPTDYDLTTNLVISTDRRMYHMTLDSPPKKRGQISANPIESYTRHVKFYYPAKHHVAVNAAAQLENQENTGTEVRASLENVNYDYSWHIENAFPWQPLAVFDDGERVYLRMPDNVEPGGVLLLGEEGDARTGSYILRENFFIIERLFDEARIVVPGPPKRKGLFGKKRQSQRTLVITKQS